MDPCYFYSGKFTRKSDVYAFRVVLLEVLSGRPAVDENLDEDQWGLAPWAQDRILEGKLNRTIDTRLIGKISSKCLKTFADIACRCLHDILNLSEKIRHEISLIRDSLASFSCHCLLWILQAIGCKCKDSTPDADELGLTPKKPETPSGSLVNCDLVSNAKTEINGLNPTPDANELDLTSKKPESPKSKNAEIEVTSLADNDSGLEPEKIKIQSVSLADFFAADQIKQHLLSFTSQKDASGNIPPSKGQNT
ncbi:concanavalin A-like lectin/glucanase [Tanacetum coccineum]